MIERLSHVTVYVVDLERAKAFYTEKLGFEVREDVTLGNFRWLTVGPKGQPDLHLVLMPIAGGNEASEALRGLVQSSRIAVGVLATRDCRKTYAELRARGVEFKSEPAERPYGIEAMLVDDSGNMFSLTERRP